MVTNLPCKAFRKRDRSNFNGSTIVISNKENLSDININDEYDFIINFQEGFGSVILVNGKENDEYVSEIQHVRRRETIAMTQLIP